jgi:hypothetical protein
MKRGASLGGHARLLALAASLAFLPSVRAFSAGPPSAETAAIDPNWPCEQIKIDHLSLATMWGGPPLGKFLTDWQQYPKAAALAQRLAQRRIPIAQAQADITSFAKAAGDQRQTELLAFVGGLFSLLDQERFAVIQGLDRFGARQKSYAAQIRGEVAALQQAEAEDAAHQDQQKISKLGEEVSLDTRVFGDRRSMISYACAVPDEIEHRLFELAGTTSNLLP